MTHNLVLQACFAEHMLAFPPRPLDHHEPISDERGQLRCLRNRSTAAGTLPGAVRRQTQPLAPGLNRFGGKIRLRSVWNASRYLNPRGMLRL